MPLDASGNASRLPGSTVVAGEDILASRYNDDQNDTVVMIGAKLDADGRKMITGDLTMALAKTITLGRDGIGDEAARVSQLSKLQAKVFNTYVDASNQGSNSISPADADITPKLQAIHDANPGKVIVIPDFGAANDLKSLTTLRWDNPNTHLRLEHSGRIIRPAGTYLTDAMISIRKRVLGGAELTGIKISGRTKLFFEPVSTHGSFIATAGQTFFPMSSLGVAVTDFVVLRTRGAVTTFLSQSSDISSANGSGFTLSAPSLAGDSLSVAIVPGNIRTCAIGIEGTAMDPVGRVDLEGYEVDGCPYLAHQGEYVRDVSIIGVDTYGCVNRGSFYPYRGIGKLNMYDCAVDGRPRSGFGVGKSLCYYGFNANDQTGDSFPLDSINISSMRINNTTEYGMGMSGDVQRAFISNITTKNTGLHALLSTAGSTEPEYCSIDGFDADGTTNEIAYIGSERMSVKNFVGRNGGSFRVGEFGVLKSGNDIDATIINSIAATDAILVRDQIDLRARLRVEGGVSTNLCTLNSVSESSVDVRTKHASAAGEGTVLNNVQSSQLTIRASGRSRGAIFLGNSSDNVITGNFRGTITTGIEFTPGSNFNIFGAATRGITFQVADNGSGNINAFSPILNNYVDKGYADRSDLFDCGTSIIPFDDTIPQSTEGVQVLSLAHTMKSATNRLRVTVCLNIYSAGVRQILSSVIQSGNANAVGATPGIYISGVLGIVNYQFEYVPGVAGAITLGVRVGPSGSAGAGVLYLNSFNSTVRALGGSCKSSISVMELLP